MKKRQLTIVECNNTFGVHTIRIDNARFHQNFFQIGKIIKKFLACEDVFLGSYRTDGIHLTAEQERKLKDEIPTFFKNNGDMQILNEYLTVAKIKLNNFDFIPFIFDYYLETMMFNSKVDWETFKQYHLAYQEHKFEDIILNHFAEVLVAYMDSGDFLICFNPQTYDPEEVRNKIKNFFEVDG